MNCEVCGRPFALRECEACEERMYAAYGDAIRVPAMWPAIERRIRAQRRQRWVGMTLAAAAAIAVVVALQWLTPHRNSP
ncbi:MAG TPA: hypothetical protein VI670_17080, partial [Thermoanaerobaculia bacterium]